MRNNETQVKSLKSINFIFETKSTQKTIYNECAFVITYVKLISLRNEKVIESYLVH